MWYAYTVGYFFSAIVGHVFISLVLDEAWRVVEAPKKVDGPSPIRPNAWQPRVIGILERVLYVASLQGSRPEFIGVWLALKAAGQWDRWKESDGRSIYQNFLIGSGLSVLYALIGFKLIGWVSTRNCLEVVSVPSILILGTLSLWMWIRRHRP